MTEQTTPEMENVSEDFAIGQSEAKKMAMQESELVNYVTKSRAPHNFNTLIPRNMAFEVQKALNDLTRRKGGQLYRWADVLHPQRPG